jgi:glutaredoxin 3
LFKKLEQEYIDINIETEPERRKEMEEKAPGVSSVPQIFINETHVGGCDELYALHEKGQLKPMLAR